MRITRTRVYMVAALAALALGAPGAEAQTIDGTLMEVGSDRPISLGLIIMMTDQGDSITSGVTDANGRFRVRSPQAGNFILIASAFGFKETRAGVFEMGLDGSMNIEFRIEADAMPIEGILVELQRPALEHRLVTSGYVRRLQRGLGHFITPYDIEQSTALNTGQIFRGIPGVQVGYMQGGLSAFQGERVQFLSGNGFCTPTVYLDGLRLSPAIVSSEPIDVLVPIQSLDAVEIYRRPSEVPLEYAGTGLQPDGEFGVCGVMVLWTKTR